MQLYAQIQQGLKVLFSFSRKSIFKQRSAHGQNVIGKLLFILLTFHFTTANSQEVPPQEVIASTNIKDKESHHLKALSKALTCVDNGKVYYKQKRYEDAIQQYKNSLKYLTGNEKSIKKQLGQTYTKIAEAYKRLINREETAKFYKKAFDVFTVLEDKKHMARTLNSLAEAERYLGRLVIALNYSTQSVEIHKRIQDPEGRAKASMGAGIIYRHIGRYEKSLDHFHEAYTYFKDVININGISKTSNEMGLIYTRLKQFDQAKYFFQATIDLPVEEMEAKTLAAALREMAVINLDGDDYESAMLMARKALEIYQKENDRLKESLTSRIIANIYRAQQDTNNAVLYYRESLALAEGVENKVYQIKAQTALAEILINQDTNEAIRLLLSSLEISKNVHNKEQTFYAYRTLRRAEDYQGNFEKALMYAKKEIALIKQLQNEKDNKKLILTKANLYSHKMEIELESLREKTKLDQLELTKKNSAIEIAEQSRTINELELVKNKYASVALACLLVMCLLIILFIFRRFVASKKRNEELDFLASRDPLTNVYNRRSLFELMNQYFSSSERDDDYCIIMADIDYFKNVNDTYGHSKGDSVIRGVASILQSCIRQNDIVARYGGEEFCIVLHKVSQEKALSIAEAMRHKVENSVFDNVAISCSFGVSSLQFNAITPSELIEQADIALYKSKSLGRNLVTLWHESFKPELISPQPNQYEIINRLTNSSYCQ